MTSLAGLIDRLEDAVARRTPLEKEHVQAVFFMFPLMFFIGVFILMPVLGTLYDAFMRDVIFLEKEFILFTNFKYLFSDPGFWNAVRFTLLFVLISVPLELAIGLMIALVMNETIPMRGLLRACVLIPWAIPAAVSGRVFELIYNYSYGAANWLLRVLHITTEPVNWLGAEIGAFVKEGIFVPPRERNVAMVFQNYALYPHMKVFDNIAFPLRVAKMDRDKIEESVRNTAAMLGIENLLDRKPGELSGGQRQRVAISRALVRRPRMFLLDEPLSNLDAQLRTSTRAELKELQNEMSITTLYVTHDQTEAMTPGDRVALLRDGELVQVGTPEALYHHPVSPFAATFIGSPPMNLLEGRKKENGTIEMERMEFGLPEKQANAAAELGREAVIVGIRPEKIQVSAEPSAGVDEPVQTTDRHLMLRGELTTAEPLGREVLYHVALKGGEVPALGEDMGAKRGDSMSLSFSAEDIHLFDAESMDRKTREQMQSGLSKENRKKIRRQSKTVA